MENKAFEHDFNDNPEEPQAYSEFSLVHDDMEELRQRLEPGVFNAPLNQGQMTLADMYKLFFLIVVPTFFFLLAIVIMGAGE